MCDLQLRAGDIVYIPPHTAHNIANTGDGLLRYIYIVAPGFGCGNDAASWHGIWVPKAFPQDRGPGDDKKYWFQEGSPVKFAVWSAGPAGAKSFDQSDMLDYPVPPWHWYPAKPDGIIVHLMTEHGATASP